MQNLGCVMSQAGLHKEDIMWWVELNLSNNKTKYINAPHKVNVKSALRYKPERTECFIQVVLDRHPQTCIALSLSLI